MSPHFFLHTLRRLLGSKRLSTHTPTPTVAQSSIIGRYKSVSREDHEGYLKVAHNRRRRISSTERWLRNPRPQSKSRPPVIAMRSNGSSCGRTQKPPSILDRIVEYQRLNGTKVTSVFMVENGKLSGRQRAGEVTVTATWPFSSPALTII